MKTETCSDHAAPLYPRRNAAEPRWSKADRPSGQEAQPRASGDVRCEPREPDHELRLAKHIETELRSVCPCRVVSVEDRVFTVDVDAPLLWEGRLVEECSAVAEKTRGVRGIRVHIRASGIHGLG
ncbi:MAG: hypothetical protein P8182_12910 [Deltaproteobacteria bacterium]